MKLQLYVALYDAPEFERSQGIFLPSCASNRTTVFDRLSDKFQSEMSNEIDSSSLPDDLPALAEAEFGTGSRAMQFLDASLRRLHYDRDTAFALLSASKGQSGESWME